MREEKENSCSYKQINVRGTQSKVTRARVNGLFWFDSFFAYGYFICIFNNSDTFYFL